MSDDIHDTIEELEARIERLAETMAGCRKWVVLAKLAMAAGAIALAAGLTGLVWLDLASTLMAIAALLGGMVLAGSNTSTLRRCEDEKRAAEQLRVQIIDGAGLPVIGAR